MIPKRNEGIDSLIKTVVENDLKGGNVYAELGSNLALPDARPGFAAHALGKECSSTLARTNPVGKPIHLVWLVRRQSDPGLPRFPD